MLKKETSPFRLKSHAPGPAGGEVPAGQREERNAFQAFLFPVAAVTNYRKLKGLKRHKLVTYSSGAQKF